MARLLFLIKALSKVLILLTVALLLHAWAQRAIGGSSSGTIERRLEEKRSRMSAVQRELTMTEQEIIELKDDEAKVIQELDRINFELSASRSSLRQTRSEMERIQDRMDRLNIQTNALVESMRKSQSYASRRLVAYYKLAQLGVAEVLVSADSFLDLWQTRADLERILEHDFEAWDRFLIQKRNLDALGRELTDQKARQDRLLKEYEEKEASLAQQKANRAKLTETIRATKQLRLASLASLQRASQELDQTIGSLERELESLSSSPGPLYRPFAELEGSLPMPVEGKIVELFGPYAHEGDYNIKGFRNGVNVMAKLGSPIRAVCDGRIVYADWFKGYGKIMIIDHGDHYYTLSAQLEELFKKRGDPVQTGEVIATFGDTAALTGPGLYFEIRHHGKPLNPMLWFKK